jgi:serine/threonine-protein kinase
MTLKPGSLLQGGQYKILRPLGRGGFGTVYCAEDQVTGELVAIKELVPALVGDAQMVQRFIQEARATQRLAHPNIVRTHSVFQDGASYCLVTEYMAGGSLGDRLRRGRLSGGEALRIMNELCAALGYAHGEGVVHCDLKPANVLFDERGRAHVADFGIAHVSEELMTRRVHTATGTAMGTVRYMAPEQLEGVRDDPRLDVYALGTMLYEMLAGRPYLDFEAETTPAAQMRNIQRIQSEQPHPLRSVNPDVPAWLAQVVERALQKAPQKRYGDAMQLRAALARPREAGAAGAAGAARPVWFWPLVAAVVVLVIALVAAIVILVGGGDRRAVTVGPVATVTRQPSPTVIGATGPSQTPVPSPLPSKEPTPTWTPIQLRTVTRAAPVTIEAPADTPEATVTAALTVEPTVATVTVPPTLTQPASPTATETRPPPKPTDTQPPPTVEPQPRVVFEDGFGGSALDGSKWSAGAGDGEIIVADGAVRMRSDGRRYPYIHTTSNPFPAEGDFQVSYRFRYVWVKDCGVGVIVSSYLVPRGLSQAEAAARQEEAEANGVQAGVWQDVGSGMQLWYRSGGDRQDVQLGGPHKDWNEMVIRYTDGRYTLLLNGSPAYTSAPTAHRPQTLWMGHPADLGANCWWSTLEVDEVRVERLP